MDDEGFYNHKLWHEIFGLSSQAFTWSVSCDSEIPKLFKELKTQMSRNLSPFLLFIYSVYKPREHFQLGGEHSQIIFNYLSISYCAQDSLLQLAPHTTVTL